MSGNSLEVKKLAELHAQLMTHDLDHVAGLNQEGHLVDLGSCENWKGRTVTNIPPDQENARDHLFQYLRQQEEAVSDFNKSMGLAQRKIVEETEAPTFGSLIGQLNQLVHTEAYFYERARQKIDAYIDNPPATPEDTEQQCAVIQDAIEVLLENITDKDRKDNMLTCLNRYAAEKGSKSVTRPGLLGKAFGTVLSPFISTSPYTPAHQQSLTAVLGKVHINTTSEKTSLGKKILTLIQAFFTRITQRKQKGEGPDPAPQDYLKQLRNAFKQDTPTAKINETRESIQQALAQINTFVKENPQHVEMVTITGIQLFLEDQLHKLNLKDKNPAWIQLSTPEISLPEAQTDKEDAPSTVTPPAQQSDADARVSSQSSPPPTPSDVPKPKPRKPKSTQPAPASAATGSAATDSAATTSAPAQRNQNRKASISKTTPSETSSTPAFTIPGSISEATFKTIKGKAFRATSPTSSKGDQTDITAVQHFVTAVTTADYKAGAPDELKVFIDKNKRHIQSRIQSNQTTPQKKELLKQMLEAIETLETNSATYLSSALSSATVAPKEPVPAPIPMPGMNKTKLSPAMPASVSTPAFKPHRMAKVNPPPLYNWGNTCFVNGYTNYLMLTLTQKDVATLQKLTPTQVSHPLALNIRDAVVALWQAYRQNPPAKDVISLQQDLLRAFTRCGNAYRQGDKDVPGVFNIFPQKTETELNSPRVGFSSVRQEDVTELHTGMHDILLKHLPSNKHMSLKTYKSAEIFGADVRHEQETSLEVGVDLGLEKDADSDRYSMQASFDSFSTTIEENITWHSEQLPPELQEYACDDVPTSVQYELNISDKLTHLTIKPKAFDYTSGRPVKLRDAPIEAFENDGNPLEIQVHNKETGQPVAMTFKPQCIVCHQSDSANSGHYYAFSFDEQGNITVHNDRTVQDFKTYLKSHGMNENMTLTEFMRYMGASPYLISYLRVA